MDSMQALERENDKGLGSICLAFDLGSFVLLNQLSAELFSLEVTFGL